MVKKTKTNLNLSCWVYGEDTQSVFVVQISQTRIVEDLKVRIKDKKPTSFDGVDTADIRLYSITIPGDNRKLNEWTVEGESCLDPLKQVSELRGRLIIVHSPNSDLMTLNCWVRGQDFLSIFPVNILGTKNVAFLWELIRDRATTNLRGMDIALYKVSFPHRTLEGDLGSCTISSLGTPLQVLDSLSTVFTLDPNSDEVHIVVGTRHSQFELELNNDHIDIEGLCLVECWVRGQNVANSFRVRVSMRDAIDDLISAICVARKYNLSPDLVKLYKVQANDGSYPDNSELVKILDSLGLGKLLRGAESLSAAFGDVPISRMPRVIIEMPEEKRPRPPLSVHSNLHGGGLANEDPIKMARYTFLTNAKPSPPSEGGVPSSFRDRQRDPYNLKSIPCGRPRAYQDMLPAVLLYPAFGQFVDGCRTIEPTPADYRLALELANTMSDLYDNEAQRQDAIAKVFTTGELYFIGSQIQTTKYVTDGDLNVKGHRYMIIEFKNEVGGNPGDPYFQGLGYYLETTRGPALRYLRSPLPCFILAVSGSLMTISGAAWNSRPLAQLLTAQAATHFDATDRSNERALACHLAALRKAAQNLEDYYRGLDETRHPTSGSLPPFLFPYPTSYHSLKDNAKKHFQYVRGWKSTMPIFQGIEETMGKKDRICIKFTTTYSCGAHNILMGLECAPALRGFEKIAGGWFMVIMDWLDDDEFETLYTYQGPLPSSTFDDISVKLGLLHSAGFVHGDFRDTNVMIHKPDMKRFMIVDFDWAGKIGEARYPADVNTIQVERPPDVRGMEEILVKHDLAMLKHIYRKFAQR